MARGYGKGGFGAKPNSKIDSDFGYCAAPNALVNDPYRVDLAPVTNVSKGKVRGASKSGGESSASKGKGYNSFDTTMAELSGKTATGKRDDASILTKVNTGSPGGSYTVRRSAFGKGATND